MYWSTSKPNLPSSLDEKTEISLSAKGLYWSSGRVFNVSNGIRVSSGSMSTRSGSSFRNLVKWLKVGISSNYLYWYWLFIINLLQHLLFAEIGQFSEIFHLFRGQSTWSRPHQCRSQAGIAWKALVSWHCDASYRRAYRYGKGLINHWWLTFLTRWFSHLLAYLPEPAREKDEENKRPINMIPARPA